MKRVNVSDDVVYLIPGAVSHILCQPEDFSLTLSVCALLCILYRAMGKKILDINVNALVLGSTKLSKLIYSLKLGILRVFLSLCWYSLPLSIFYTSVQQLRIL